MWTVLVPLKPLNLAKSRLRGALPDSALEALVLDMALSTANAVQASGSARRIVFVTNARLPDFETTPDLCGDLNTAIGFAERTVSGPVAVLPADLPALAPDELREALWMAMAGRCFVADLSGTGTTLLAAPKGGLSPSFGPGSALAHERSGARRLHNPWPTLRLDVDTAADLAHAARLGWRPPAIVTG